MDRKIAANRAAWQREILTLRDQPPGNYALFAEMLRPSLICIYSVQKIREPALAEGHAGEVTETLARQSAIRDDQTESTRSFFDRFSRLGGAGYTPETQSYVRRIAEDQFSHAW